MFGIFYSVIAGSALIGHEISSGYERTKKRDQARLLGKVTYLDENCRERAVVDDQLVSLNDRGQIVGVRNKKVYADLHKEWTDRVIREAKENGERFLSRCELSKPLKKRMDTFVSCHYGIQEAYYDIETENFVKRINVDNTPVFIDTSLKILAVDVDKVWHHYEDRNVQELQEFLNKALGPQYFDVEDFKRRKFWWEPRKNTTANLFNTLKVVSFLKPSYTYYYN